MLIALQLNIIVINTVVCFATESVQNGKRVQLFNKNNNQEKWLAPRQIQVALQKSYRWRPTLVQIKSYWKAVSCAYKMWFYLKNRIYRVESRKCRIKHFLCKNLKNEPHISLILKREFFCHCQIISLHSQVPIWWNC